MSSRLRPRESPQPFLQVDLRMMHFLLLCIGECRTPPSLSKDRFAGYRILRAGLFLSAVCTHFQCLPPHGIRGEMELPEALPHHALCQAMRHRLEAHGGEPAEVMV